MPLSPARLRLKRAYDPPDAADGTRVLVDRIWPRGVTKQALAADLWLKELAPSTGLRRWFGHDPAKWDEFCRRYQAEIAGREELDQLRALARKGPVTLVYAARDQDHNNAVALREMLLSDQG
ncbi:DUF488 domain-containing protein [Pseudogemmobacter humi]|uniref:Uroporphyrin-III C-methyltransferase n=1 Tax=Pseudogemmobacter humi TaxID=2483812 RepID=A0A3P5XN53_9RHOB|nr:DUF488 domain-containing protein [Pseudogemmobacter humi]VDC31759.1 hypothetical protein XINFAN_03114 [Pseudogemmobacter humi]